MDLMPPNPGQTLPNPSLAVLQTACSSPSCGAGLNICALLSMLDSLTIILMADSDVCHAVSS